MSLELKIKFLTLGYEAKQIRRFEQKLKRMRSHKSSKRATTVGEIPMDTEERAPGSPLPPWNSPNKTIPGHNPAGYERWGNAKLLELKAHRRMIVRPEARRTHLARMFLKGTPYSAAEAKVHPNNMLSEGEWNAIQRMAEKYALYHKMGDATPPKGSWASIQQVAQRFAEWKETA